MDGEKKRSTFLSKAAVVLFAAAGAVMLLLLGYLGTVDNVQVFQSRQDPGFIRIENYICREVESEDAPIGVVKEYRMTVGEALIHDAHFAFYVVHQYADVYLDGQLVYSLRPSEENRIGKTTGSNWVMIPLYREDAGKELRVEITPVYESFRDREVEFLVGSQLEIYVNRLSRDLPQLILGTIAVFVGLVILCVAGYDLFRRKKGEGLAALGVFSIMMGLWRLTDTRFTPFLLSEKPVFLFYTSIAMLMLGMVPLIRSMKARFNPLSRCLLDGCCMAASLVCLVQLILQVSGTADLREDLVVTHFVIAIGALLILGNVAYDRVKFPQKNKRRTGRKLPLVCVAGVLADVIAYYVMGTSSGLIFSLTAFLLYVVFTGIIMLFDYGEQEKRLREQETQLAESRIAVMFSQIQPHFLYNALGSIYHLCGKDPQQAQKAVGDFSDYLRMNLSSIRRTTPIPFATELKHIETYLNLEKMSSEDELNFRFDIRADDFSVPSLSIQPLVENAVKHGIFQKPGGGTVSIQSMEYPDHFEVVVADDGVGFDPERPPEDEKPHIGIENTRQRLAAMCGGTLRIESSPGAGTTATVTIPKTQRS